MSERRQPADSDRREEILRAALRLFVRDGYAATGVRAIAAEVGIREASIYHYFDSKDEIFGAIIEQASTGSLRIQEVPPEVDLREALTYIGRGFLDAMAIPSARDMVHLMLFESAHHPNLAEWYLREVHDPAVARVTAVVADRLPPNSPVSASSLARIFSAALVSHVLHEERLAGVAGRDLVDGVEPRRYEYLDDVVTVVVGAAGLS